MSVKKGMEHFLFRKETNAAYLVLLVATFTEVNTEISGTNKLCTTPQCLHTSSYLWSSMDLTVDPCDDFFKFSCGNFLDGTYLKAKNDNPDMISALTSSLREKLFALFMEKSDDRDLKVYRNVKKMFKMCMDEDVTKLRMDLNKTFQDLGGWPVVRGADWNKDGNWNWKNAELNFMRRGMHSLTTSLDYEGHKSHKVMIDSAISFGADKDRATKEMDEVIQLRTQIDIIFEEAKNIKKYEEISLGELEQEVPTINWTEQIKALVPEHDVSNETIVNLPYEYMKALEQLLEKNPARTIANYMFWLNVKSFSNVLIDRDSERWKHCVELMTDKQKFEVAAMYVRKYFPPAKHIHLMRMIENIREQIKLTLSETDLFSDEFTRFNALAKLDKMHERSLVNSDWYNDAKLNELHRDFQINSNSFVNSTLMAHKARIICRFRMNKLSTASFFEYAFDNRVFQVDAFNVIDINKIAFTTPLMDEIMLSISRPEYMNYGSIGYIIGHEIIHAYNGGRKMDFNGDKYNWWLPESNAKFEQRTKCFVDQYEIYSDEESGLHMNGTSTLDENISDNAGLLHAYLAYQKIVRENGIEDRLPGFESFSPNQMFWVAFASSLCEVPNSAFFKKLVESDVHSPSRFRIYGAIENSEEFSRDFNCPIGSRMNPMKKCKIF